MYVSPVNGTYKGQPEKRSYIFKLLAINRIKSFKVNNRWYEASVNVEITFFE